MLASSQQQTHVASIPQSLRLKCPEKVPKATKKVYKKPYAVLSLSALSLLALEVPS
jgi:hypothetical protein